jgi:hypothetical protein
MVDRLHGRSGRSAQDEYPCDSKYLSLTSQRFKSKAKKLRGSRFLRKIRENKSQRAKEKKQPR